MLSHRRYLGLVAVVTLALAVPVANALSAPRTANTVPLGLLGTWTHTVKHVGVGTSVTAGSRFTITIKKDGTLDMKNPSGSVGNWVGTIWGAGANRLRLEIIGPGKQYFSWHVNGRKLAIATWPGHKNFVDHDAIFLGAWTKK